VDSVFSMEGTLANLPTIVQLARQYGARTMVDEAHAIGVLGPGGRGGAEHFGVLDKVDVVMGTFSKSFASVGGFVAANYEVVEYLRHVARSHIFSASLPPPAAAAVRAALEIIKNEPERRQRVIQNAAYMAGRLQALGFDAPFHGTPVVPVRCDNDALTLGAFKRLLEKGVFVNPVLEPAVPKGREMLRTSYMASHTQAMLDRAAAVFESIRTPLFPKRHAAAASSLRVRPMVLLPVADRFSFYDQYFPESSHGRLRVPGFTRLEVGQAVDCGISFDKEHVIMQSPGRVVSKALVPLAEAPLGIEVELLAGEIPSRALIERFASGQESVPGRRRSWRYHADIQVELSFDGATQSGAVEDISLDGMSIRSGLAPDCGARVSLRLTLTSGAPIQIPAEVRWRREGAEPMLGVEFRFERSEDREAIQALITTIRREITETASGGAGPHLEGAGDAPKP
jgi:hypothetical protein